MYRLGIPCGDRCYAFAPEDPPPPGNRLQALVQARMLDDTSRTNVDSVSTVHCDFPALKPRIAGNGVVGLAGRPDRVFGDSTASLSLRLEIGARGYLPLVRQLALDPTAPLPLALGDLHMHRRPQVLQGRVIQAGAAVAAANVTVTHIWRAPPDPDEAPPGRASHLVAIRPGLHRPLASGLLRRRTVTPVSGEDMPLAEATYPGSTRLHLATRIHLDPGDWVLLDPDRENLAESNRITDIRGSGPAILDLAYPLRHGHRPETPLRGLTLGAAGPDHALEEPDPEPEVDWTDRDFCLAGDRCLFLQDLTGLDDPGTVELVAGTHRELQWMEPYAAGTDERGHFRLPPLGRVAQVRLRAEGGDLTESIEETIALRPDRPVQAIELNRR